MIPHSLWYSYMDRDGGIYRTESHWRWLLLEKPYTYIQTSVWTHSERIGLYLSYLYRRDWLICGLIWCKRLIYFSVISPSCEHLCGSLCVWSQRTPITIMTYSLLFWNTDTWFLAVWDCRLWSKTFKLHFCNIISQLIKLKNVSYSKNYCNLVARPLYHTFKTSL